MSSIDRMLSMAGDSIKGSPKGDGSSARCYNF